MNSNHLSTEQGRLAAINQIKTDFLQALRTNGFEIAPDAVCDITATWIQLGLPDAGGKTIISNDSLITIYTNGFALHQVEMDIKYSGRFSYSRGVYWRAIHAASIFRNWKLTCDIVNKHCMRYELLTKECLNLKTTT